LPTPARRFQEIASACSFVSPRCADCKCGKAHFAYWPVLRIMGCISFSFSESRHAELRSPSIPA
jgi:hypothetical protein